MVQPGIAPEPESRSNDLLGTLEQLLSIEVLDLKSALDQASNLVSAALKAEKVDIFVHDVTTQSLVARGTSNTPMGRLQVAIGLDRQPIANGGRAVQVFQTGQSWREGHTDEDPEELLGIKQGLGVRSEIAAPLDVNGERRGALSPTAQHQTGSRCTTCGFWKRLRAGSASCCIDLSSWRRAFETLKSKRGKSRPTSWLPSWHTISVAHLRHSVGAWR